MGSTGGVPFTMMQAIKNGNVARREREIRKLPEVRARETNAESRNSIRRRAEASFPGSSVYAL